MAERPALSSKLSSKIFRKYYYLKEELAEFCRDNNLPASGGKTEITERIACFLDTGQILPFVVKRRSVQQKGELAEDSVIETDFICSENHRSFFKEKIGRTFSFNVVFQKWLKSNAGKTYSEAIKAYHQIQEEKKKSKTTIDKQFEYNTYIRDFFADNKGKFLKDAIKCWKYKKSLQGHNRYEKSDTTAIQ